MPKQSTMCANNEFYKARMSASSCNDRLSSREGASEETGIDRTRLARIELGNIVPYPEEVLLMADTYNSPQLPNYYCSKMCPLGKKTVPPAEVHGLDRLTILLITALRNSDKIKEVFLEVAMDGKITPDEFERVAYAESMLEQIVVRAQETRILIASMKGGKHDGSSG